jgi:hypothetical protein
LNPSELSERPAFLDDSRAVVPLRLNEERASSTRNDANARQVVQRVAQLEECGEPAAAALAEPSRNDCVKFDATRAEGPTQGLDHPSLGSTPEDTPEFILARALELVEALEPLTRRDAIIRPIVAELRGLLDAAAGPRAKVVTLAERRRREP